MKKIKIFADFNNADKNGRLRLNTFGSKRDIEKLGIKLTPGLKIILDDENSLSADGVLEYSSDENIWVAKIDWDAIKNY